MTDGQRTERKQKDLTNGFIAQHVIYGRLKNHYNNILINIESYVLYCKVEHVEIDFKKITERLRFIKQYIKDNYDIEIV